MASAMNVLDILNSVETFISELEAPKKVKAKEIEESWAVRRAKDHEGRRKAAEKGLKSLDDLDELCSQTLRGLRKELRGLKAPEACRQFEASLKEASRAEERAKDLAFDAESAAKEGLISYARELASRARESLVQAERAKARAEELEARAAEEFDAFERRRLALEARIEEERAWGRDIDEARSFLLGLLGKRPMTRLEVEQALNRASVLLDQAHPLLDEKTRFLAVGLIHEAETDLENGAVPGKVFRRFKKGWRKLEKDLRRLARWSRGVKAPAKKTAKKAAKKAAKRAKKARLAAAQAATESENKAASKAAKKAMKKAHKIRH